MRIMTDDGISGFYLTEQQLQNSPSRRDGIDPKRELALRFEGSLLVREIGIKLRQPQVVMATGQVLFHRFFSVISFASYDVRRAAKACEWLASRLEECPRKLQDVLLLYRHIDRLHENLPQPGLLSKDEFSKLQKDLFVAEEVVLRALGYVCNMNLPYIFILVYLKELEAPFELQQVAWNITNDSFCTTLCIRCKSHVVACGIIQAAAQKLSIPLPKKWFEILADVTWEEIEVVCQALHEFYRDHGCHFSPTSVLP
ncbi:hypothetical protein KC19_2G125500 [Ceratodon purpureus]|uniref:Cyclin-like domain-containing protein n=1 Tax=Ceratodon purpureus TaxID=3225 RepID=A0A8T0IUT0_CERPU|nr:hypothetical protein KC19_2G125500 [Ceratodon purpureus]